MAATTMGTKTAAMVMVMVVMVAVAVVGTKASMCDMDEEGLMACKPSVTPPPPEPAEPSAACCDALRGADLKCLCSYKNSFMLPSFGIDPDLALALPPKCNLLLPPGC